jgi:hypothetical protein
MSARFRRAVVWRAVRRVGAFSCTAVAGLIFASGHPVVCHQEFGKNASQVVELCRPPQWQDPPVLAAAGMILTLLFAELAEIKVGEFSLKRDPGILGLPPEQLVEEFTAASLDTLVAQKRSLISLLVRGCAYGIPATAELVVTFVVIEHERPISIAHALASTRVFPPEHLEKLAGAHELKGLAERARQDGYAVGSVRIYPDADGLSQYLAVPAQSPGGPLHGVLLALTLNKREIRDELAPPTDLLLSHLWMSAQVVAQALDSLDDNGTPKVERRGASESRLG